MNADRCFSGEQRHGIGRLSMMRSAYRRTSRLIGGKKCLLRSVHRQRSPCRRLKRNSRSKRRRWPGRLRRLSGLWEVVPVGLCEPIIPCFGLGCRLPASRMGPVQSFRQNEDRRSVGQFVSPGRIATDQRPQGVDTGVPKRRQVSFDQQPDANVVDVIVFVSQPVA